MMKPSIGLGLLGGAILSLFNLYGMFRPLPYATWNFINSSIYILFVLVIAGLAVYLVRKNHKYSRVVASVTVASLFFAGVYLASYWIATARFADQLHQLPFFAKDYSYHGYSSPKQYLFSGNNYYELMQLQVFSTGLSVLFQITFASVLAFVARLTVLGPTPGR